VTRQSTIVFSLVFFAAAFLSCAGTGFAQSIAGCVREKEACQNLIGKTLWVYIPPGKHGSVTVCSHSYRPEGCDVSSVGSFEVRSILHRSASDVVLVVTRESGYGGYIQSTEFPFLVTTDPALIAARIPKETPARKRESSGTGFVISKDGLVLTNFHVVDDCRKLTMRVQGVSKEVVVVASDKTNDLAVVRGDTNGIEPLTFRDDQPIRPAEAVIAVGFPLKGILSTAPNISTGTISALTGLRDDTRMLQISAPIQPGNSGGPLLDSSGNVVGVIVATINALAVAIQTGSIPQNINFAIKGSIVKLFLQSRNIPFLTAPTSTPLNASDVGDKGARAVVLLECS
jgi:S1-C subfamily serine protease